MPERPVLLVLLAACMLSNIAAAQSVSVQFVDGRSGKPVGKDKAVHVYFSSGTTRKLLLLHTDGHGEVQFDAAGAKAVEVTPVGYVACGKPSGSPGKFSIEDVVSTGLLTENNCGHVAAKPAPGRLLYFVKPESWREVLKSPPN